MATQEKSVSRYYFLWLMLCTNFCMSLSDVAVCKKWSDIANSMSNNGQFTCRNNATKICTRYDCEGSSVESFSRVVEIDYCFGMQLNSCLDPLSLDFYVKIPSHNISAQHRVTHDQIVSLSDLGIDIPEVKNLPIQPLLDFELEKDGTESVLVSVTFKVRSNFGSLYLDQFQQSIIEEEELPLEHCNGPLTTDSSGKPASDFMSAPCHINKYSGPSTTPKTVTPSQKPKVNKTCDFLNGCSQGETCQMSEDGKGMCVCEPDYTYHADIQACVSQGKVGSDCRLNRDCGVYEECRRDTTKSTSSADGRTCQCEDSFNWDEERRLCVLDTSKHRPHSHSDDEDHSHHTASPDKPTPSTTTTEKPSNHTGVDKQKHNAASSHTKYIIIASAAVGGVVLIAGVVAGLLLCRRRRRDRFANRSGGGLYDSDTQMLTDTDDDVDLIM